MGVVDGGCVSGDDFDRIVGGNDLVFFRMG